MARFFNGLDVKQEVKVILQNVFCWPRVTDWEGRVGRCADLRGQVDSGGASLGLSPEFFPKIDTLGIY